MDSNRSIRHEKINTYRRKIKTLPKKGCQNKNDLILFNHKKQKKAGNKKMAGTLDTLYMDKFNKWINRMGCITCNPKRTYSLPVKHRFICRGKNIPHK